MAQVVNSENFEQFVTTGRVDEFKPPEEAPREPQEETVQAVDEPEKDAAKAEDDDDKDLTERVRQKIGAKHRAMKEAEEFAEREYNERRAAEKRADDLERKLKEIEEKSRPAVVEAKEPKQSDFQTVEEYIEAVTEYKFDQRLKKDRENQEHQRIAAEANRVRESFNSKLQDAMKSIPDFEEVTSAVNTELPEHVTQHILESDVGPLLGYHLAKHPDELSRITKLSPIRAIAELGKLEAKLEAKPEAKSVASKAPAPIKPIDGKAANVVADLNKNLSFADYKALKQQQAKSKR